MDEIGQTTPKKLGRPSEVDNAQVIAAGERIKARGESVNASNLRKEVGAGAKDRLFTIWETHLKEQLLPSEVSAVFAKWTAESQAHLTTLLRESFAACERIAASKYASQEAEYKAKIADLEQERRDSDQLIQTIDDQLQQEQELRMRLESELAAARAVIETHTGEVKALQSAKDDVERRLGVATEQAASLRMEIGGLKEARSTDQETINSLRLELRDTKLSLDAVSDASHKQKSEIARLSEKVKGLENQVCDKERLLDQTRTENTRLSQLLTKQK